MFRSQKYGRGDAFWLRIPDDKGGPGNPSAPIDVNAFRTTNFRSRSAMRGAEFHGNTRRDSTTRIPSIDPKDLGTIQYAVFPQDFPNSLKISPKF